eukprot:TRINITY_DN6222_c0_g1_i1.p1 TRINITY_DN6222_c0_g1~~TRINITY_DN6222_c0_g1_i1.p1  ORF type:complete len:235 (+),score=25.59 TRINITY_DN6222_c0_g1_i1:31-735(+)
MARGSCGQREKLVLPLRLIKYFLFGINILFLLLGLLLIILGSVAIAFDVVSSLLQIPKFALAIIILGCAVIFIAIIGGCASYHQIRWLLIFYVIFLAIIIIAQISVAIAASAFSGQVRGLLEKGWVKIKDPEVLISVERTFNCCGFYNYTDNPAGNCSVALPGCYFAIEKYVKDKIDIVAISASIIGAFELIGLGMAIVLFAMMRKYTVQDSSVLNYDTSPIVPLVPEKRRKNF